METKPDEKSAKETTHVSRNTNNETVFTIDLETQKRMVLIVEPLAQTNRQPEIVAFGKVIDPSPLIALNNDLNAAEATLEISRKQAERSRKLFAEAENVSRKTVETAEAQLRADEIKSRALLQRLAVEWGSAMVKLDSTQREKLIEQLVAQEIIFVRVDLAAGQNISGNPTSARVEAFDQLFPATVFSAASGVNSNSQGQGFLLQVSGKNTALRPELFVKAYLTIPG
ncbi:MAG: hypothetical protein ACR2H1_14585, partial [Limisphaerales bacterium]